ncbi:MAG: alpha-2-macroglobulin family protein [Bacteroidales bacterium]|nr:alpha-2-macroglobulin family protein [Bacteroidales bacterium]
MKKFLQILGLFIASTIATYGQSYDKLWKDAEAAIDKDQPQSALAFVEQVYAKALDEDNDAQLLRAVLIRLQLKGDVAPDSAAVLTARLETTALTTPSEEEFMPVRALWLAAAGQVRLTAYDDTAATARGRKLLQMALADFEPLGAARATDYLPLFTQGADSRYYHDDLLSVIARPVLDSHAFRLEEKQQLAARLIAYYKGKGNREAALLATLDSIGLSGQDNALNEKALRRTAEEYRDLALNVETYIAMTNLANRTDATNRDSLIVATAREGLSHHSKTNRAEVLRHLIAVYENPTLELHADHNVFYPSKPSTATLKSRNVRRATLKLYRLDVNSAADSRLIDLTPKKARKIGCKLVQTLNHDFAARPKWDTQTDSVTLCLAEPGVYWCELEADGTEAGQTLLYASRLMPITLTVDDDFYLVRLVDAESGTPIQGGKVTIYTETDNGRLQKKAFTAEPTGEIKVPRDNRSYGYLYYAATADDAFLPDYSFYYTMPWRPARQNAETHVKLYTDRAIYRPGQTVAFSGLVYTQEGDAVTATPGFETVVRLLDSKSKEVARLTCHTDSFGTLSGSFTLPAACLPGRFSLRGERGGYALLRVEEYKRPTFTVELSAPDTAFRLGDSITLSGTATTLTGLPVPDARISYSVARAAYWFVRSDNRTLVPQTGEAVTDSLGRFSIPLRLEAGTTDTDNWRHCTIRFTASVDVTASNGETASADLTVMASQRAAWLSTDWSTSICKETMGRFSVALTGNAGKDLGGEVNYAIWHKNNPAVVAKGTLRSGSSFVPQMLRDLPSGEYEVAFSTPDPNLADTLTRHFLLFSESDTRPAGDAVQWQYVRYSTARDSVLVVIGSPRRDVTLFYDLFANGKRLESNVITFSDSLLRFPLAYREEWGDGARACFAFVKDGELYAFTTDIQKPVPDKRLLLQWQTFRDLLTPGQAETWQLRVTLPDGSPAEASLMARLYDASLDAFATNPWRFDLSFSRQRQYVHWRDHRSGTAYLNWAQKLKALETSDLSFTVWDDRLFDTPYTRRFSRNGMVMYAMAAAPSADMMVAEDRMLKVESTEAGSGAEDNASAATSAEVDASAVRTDFAETAFFYPALRTDADGVVTLQFTLPQSLTAWNFSALAHTRGMANGRLDTTVVARKAFMVQPALPRFVRRGDRAVLPVTLRSLTDETIAGTLTCQLVDPETERVVKSFSQSFSLGAQATATAAFEVAVEFTQPVLVCRIVASGNGFSDGEAHYLPVLSDRVNVVESLPFAMTEAGTVALRIDTLWSGNPQAEDRRLTVELTSNPLWYAIAALPDMTTRSRESATGWAERLYAVSLADAIASQHPDIARLLTDSAAVSTDILARNPELKQTLLAETPWAAEATTEAERLAALRNLFDPQAVAAARYTAIDKLKDLQRPDGSWSWFPGMGSNDYITTEVAVLLARLEAFGGDRSACTLLDKAMKYLDNAMQQAVAEMKKNPERDGINNNHLRYLYIRALRGVKPDATANYLLERAIAASPSDDMYEKAILAVVLVKAGRKTEAADVLKSLEEHTVSTPDMGRYFDTKRAAQSWRSYRIPTQTATIEAFVASGEDHYMSLAEEMRLWLMQTKRTQMWQAEGTTANAVYALLTTSASKAVPTLTTSGQPVLYTLTRGKDIVGFNAPSQAEGRTTVGYYCDTYTDAKALAAQSITLRKSTDGLSWGSVYAQYTVPASQVETSATGLSLTRRFEVWRNNSWTPLAEHAAIAPGERVRQVFTLTADRDFDFVSLKSARAANLEPRNALSGRLWTGGLSAYRVVRDASTEFFIERLRKGSYTLTEEYITDRAGTYQCGTSRVQSLYAPEFNAQTAGFVIGATTK